MAIIMRSRQKQETSNGLSLAIRAGRQLTGGSFKQRLAELSQRVPLGHPLATAAKFC